MMLFCKYDIGDRVYRIENVREKVKIPCGFCSGLGEITGDNGDSVPCPQCWRRGVHEEWSNHKWVVDPKSKTIGKIEIVHYGDEECEELRRKNGANYMCQETGVGSGTVFREELLYPSYEAAQEKCDELNDTGASVESPTTLQMCGPRQD